MLKPLRYLVAIVAWPVVNVIDRLQRCDRPVSLHRGLEWARSVQEHQTAPTAPTAVRPALRAPARPAAARVTSSPRLRRDPGEP